MYAGRRPASAAKTAGSMVLSKSPTTSVVPGPVLNAVMTDSLRIESGMISFRRLLFRTARADVGADKEQIYAE